MYRPTEAGDCAVVLLLLALLVPVTVRALTAPVGRVLVPAFAGLLVVVPRLGRCEQIALNGLPRLLFRRHGRPPCGWGKSYFLDKSLS